MKVILLAVFSIVVLTNLNPSVNQMEVNRRVEGQRLISPTMPAIQLEFARSFKYVGSQSFILYDVARAEQHFFVDSDKQGRIKRLYWIQFEGYLPNNTHTYDYKASKQVTIGGFDFIADACQKHQRQSRAR